MKVWCDIPDVLVALDVDLVELLLARLAGDVGLHLHGDVARQHRQQQALLHTHTAIHLYVRRRVPLRGTSTAGVGNFSSSTQPALTLPCTWPPYYILASKNIFSILIKLFPQRIWVNIKMPVISSF